MVDGKTAIITGGSRGIGFGIAAELIAGGANVCLTGRNADQLATARAELGADAQVLTVPGKSHDAEHRADAVARTVDRFGSIDILVNNAATNPQFGPLVDADLGAVSKVFEVNVAAPIGWIQEVWRASMSERGGTILNVASIGGIRPGGHIGAYNAGKAALIHLTKQFASELAPGVRVNAIAPAVVKTDFVRALWEADEEGAASVYPLGRLGTVEDTGAAARFLLSDDASWITGETLVLDGGLNAT
jgi:NAD(P)-dependent dehydrogenase (short-subunit alcohol dehydrogenase family)